MITPAKDIYASRADRGAAIIARQDPVVYAGGSYAEGTSAENIAAFDRDGFLFLENLFSEKETAVLLAEVERLAKDPATRHRDEAIREPGSDLVRSVFKVHELSPVLQRLSRDARLANIARQILGSETYIHQSRANLKPGFHGKEFYWHSDFETWHVEDGMPAMRAISCSVLLTDNVAENGPLMVVPESHRQFISCIGETPDNHYQESLRKQEYGVPDPVSLQILVEQGGIRSITGKAGSVVFFDCNLMHGSIGNITPWPRANVFMVYNSMENTLEPPKYGLAPRPEFVATRERFEAIKPLEPTQLGSR
ncbi:MAG: ectoine hydroxylase [Pigmentiphaga sp.]